MNKKDEILNKLCQKAATKQLVYRTSKDVFKELKIVLKEIQVLPKFKNISQIMN